MRPMGLRKFGSNAGHQDCGDCHPEQKALVTRGRQAALRDVSAGLGDLRDEIDAWWEDFHAQMARDNRL